MTMDNAHPLDPERAVEHPVGAHGGGVDPASMRSTMGAFPTGVTVITALAGETPVGATISAFTSVSLDPPMVLVCVSRHAGILTACGLGRPMVVNVLGRAQAEVARRFAERRADRFGGVEYVPGPGGVPVLTGTAAWVGGVVERLDDAGDHVIVLVRVTDVYRSTEPPLLYHSGAFYDWDPARDLPPRE